MARKAASRLDQPRDRAPSRPRPDRFEPPRPAQEAPAPRPRPARGRPAPAPVGSAPPERAPRPYERPPLPSRPRPPVELRVSLGDAVGGRALPSALRRLDEAKRAFAAERYDDARRTLAPLLRLAPDVAELRELFGLTMYQLRRWNDAIRELERFRVLTGSPEQDPVLADAYRALRRWRDVDELWAEVRDHSPSAELVTEGRIVAAGALADRGDLKAALALLEKGWQPPAHPGEHHLRRAYALADLYERSGATIKARELFRWILHHDRQFSDTAERVAQLR